MITKITLAIVFSLFVSLGLARAESGECPNVKGVWNEVFAYPYEYQHTKSLNFVERSQFLDVSTYTSNKGSFEIVEKLPLDGTWVKIDTEKGDGRYRQKRMFCHDNKLYVDSQYIQKRTEQVLSQSISHYELTPDGGLHWQQLLISSRDHEFRFEKHFTRAE